ncbi:hypothetical protein CRENBAI_003924 [Crenichthys baileyi]|uniref:Uncharacterized protein n=1 Tax=Crenichthys baileyi TaxID=28760 RepID=A0AAV9QSD1_9TELE
MTLLGKIIRGRSEASVRQQGAVARTESSQQRPCLYDAEWSSFSRSEGRTTGPHHRGYSYNVPTERAAPPHSYGG